MNQSRKGLLFLCVQKLIDHTHTHSSRDVELLLFPSPSSSLSLNIMPLGGCCSTYNFSKKETPAFIAQIHLKSTFVSFFPLFQMEWVDSSWLSMRRHAISSQTTMCIAIVKLWKKGKKGKGKKKEKKVSPGGTFDFTVFFFFFSSFPQQPHW